MKVLAAKRTGSTILQNIVYFLVHGKPGVIQKKHSFSKDNNTVFVPIRDPRDVIISDYRICVRDLRDIKIENLNILNHAAMFNNLDLMKNLYNFYKDKESALIVRYEDVFSDGVGKYDKIIDVIVEFLDIEPSKECIDNLKNHLAIEKVKNRSDSLKRRANVDSKSASPYYICGNHISSSSFNNLTWKDIVDKSLHKKFNDRLIDYIESLEYRK